MPVFDAQSQCSASQSCWPVGLSQQSLYCIIGPAAQPAPQVCPDVPTLTSFHCCMQHEGSKAVRHMPELCRCSQGLC